MINKVILIGNLGHNPEQRFAGETEVANLSVATTRRVKKGEQWENETEWHRVTAFGSSAKFANQYLTKGSKVYVEGRLRTRKYQAKDGSDRYATEIIAERLQSLDSRKEREEQNDGFESAPRKQAPATTQSFETEDCPF